VDPAHAYLPSTAKAHVRIGSHGSQSAVTRISGELSSSRFFALYLGCGPRQAVEEGTRAAAQGAQAPRVSATITPASGAKLVKRIYLKPAKRK
jgi:hypothetical protein